MVNLPIHDNVSGLNVVWNLNYITILDTIHVKMPTEHGNWLSIYIYISSLSFLRRAPASTEDRCCLSFGTDIPTASRRDFMITPLDLHSINIASTQWHNGVVLNEKTKISKPKQVSLWSILIRFYQPENSWNKAHFSARNPFLLLFN